MNLAVCQLIGGEVQTPGGSITWTMILQYKHVERVVYDIKIKYMNSEEESAMVMK